MKSYSEFLQEIRKEELHLKPNEALIPVAHFHKVAQLLLFKFRAWERIIFMSFYT